MGFLTGRVTCTRFRVNGRALKTFGVEHLDALSANAIGTQRIASGDGSSVGWIAGDHILDTSFDLAKNVINDALLFEMRVDQHKVPANLLKAYYQTELKALAASNPSGFPSTKQKRQAREYARDRLENEAKDGRFLRRNSVPILWDSQSNELLVGSTSLPALDRLVGLFHQTFERKFELMAAGRRAYVLAEEVNLNNAIDNATPTIFVNGGQTGDIAWSPDDNSRDFLGNEFLLWLWFYLENESDTLKLSDQSEVTMMVARSLGLECPRGQFGKDSITSDGPAKLPEAQRAIQAGKLPRKMGLTLVRHDAQYELMLQAETLSVTGAKLPPAEEEDSRAKLDERISSIRHLLDTLDLTYRAFVEKRLGAEWTREAQRIREWLSLGNNSAAA